MIRPLLCALLTGLLLLGGCASYRESEALYALETGDVERAFVLTRALARRGHDEFQFRLGLMYIGGKGVRRDEEIGMAWLRKAARQGHVASRARLTATYLEGLGGVSVDPDAELWMSETAMSGTPDTRYKLARLYFNGEIVDRDPQKGLRWLELAEASWPESGRPLRSRLRDDGLMPLAAELGLKEAQYGMAQSYAGGTNVPKSKSEAAKWYFLAGSRGHAGAQHALGWIYSQGEGVSIDHAEAARWFAKAAEQGHVGGQFQLGLLFERGIGLPLDPIQAHMWFNIAAAGGHQKSRTRRAVMTKRISPMGLAQAEELAVEWWKRHGGPSSDPDAEVDEDDDASSEDETEGRATEEPASEEELTP